MLETRRGKGWCEYSVSWGFDVYHKLGVRVHVAASSAT